MINSVSEEQKLKTLAINTVSRELEVNSYDLNIRNYKAILDSLPTGEWPVEILQYKYLDIASVPHEHVENVSKFNFRDRLDYLLRTEVNERTKSFMLYQAMYNQLPDDRLEELLTFAYNYITTPQNTTPV
jgi:hypothetical protein